MNLLTFEEGAVYYARFGSEVRALRAGPLRWVMSSVRVPGQNLLRVELTAVSVKVSFVREELPDREIDPARLCQSVQEAYLAPDADTVTSNEDSAL